MRPGSDKTDTRRDTLAHAERGATRSAFVTRRYSIVMHRTRKNHTANRLVCRAAGESIR